MNADISRPLVPAHLGQLRISVVMLGYEDRANLEEALGSVLDQDFGDYSVVFIDNASSDGSSEYVRARFPEVEVRTLPENLGYAGAYAMVLHELFAGGADAAVLLNADVRVDRAWLRELAASAYAADSIGFAQPKIYLWNETRLNSFGNAINYLGFGFCAHLGESDLGLFRDDRPVTFASGASMLVKRQAYADTGGFDPQFFCYVEDQDLCWRGRMRGWTSIVSAKSLMWHKYRLVDPVRNARKLYYYERNRLTFVLQSYSLTLLVLAGPAFVVTELGLLALALRQGWLKDKLQAYGRLLSNCRRILASRRRIQAQRLVQDRDLVHLLSGPILIPGLTSGWIAQSANKALSGYLTLIRALMAWMPSRGQRRCSA